MIVAGAVAAVLVGAASLAIAENNGMMGKSTRVTDMHGDGGQQAVLQVGPKGETLMRGTVKVVGTSSLTVTSWGGDWVVNVSADTKLGPQTTGISQFTVGEFVGVHGETSQTAAWNIEADTVRSWTAKKAMMQNTEGQQGNNEDHQTPKPATVNNANVQERINSILEQIKKIQAQINSQSTTSTTTGQ